MGACDVACVGRRARIRGEGPFFGDPSVVFLICEPSTLGLDLVVCASSWLFHFKSVSSVLCGGEAAVATGGFVRREPSLARSILFPSKLKKNVVVVVESK